MLRRITVRNYAIIQDLDMSFGEGFTIITGETGAGKSILLGALGLVLGERADTSVLLNKSEKCIVEADFNIKGYDLEELFYSNEIDYDDTALMRREINTSGKSRAFINDTPVTLNVMREIGDRLIDIHSQHQTLLLGNSQFQMRVVDAFAGTSSLFRDYIVSYRRYSKLKHDFEAAASVSDRDRADYDYFSHQLEQLLAAKLLPGEQAELEKEQEMLTNAGVIKESLSMATGELAGEDVSVLALLREARNNLSKIAEWMPAASDLEKRIETCLIELNDISYEAEKLHGIAEADPGRLDSINQRLDTIYSLMQKHRCNNLEELIEKQKEIEARVANVTGVDERLGEMKKAMDEAFSACIMLADKLSVKRKASSGKLDETITLMLQKLGMPHARFETRFAVLDSPGPSGIDKIDFLFSANRQVTPEELSKIASGGELSRVMLCLKSTLASTSGLPAIIFDEIDSGVSGEVASMVGTILSEMGDKMQVINITHLPQVASRGNIHYHVYKEDDGNSTITKVKLLSKEERLTEVARLLSGSKVTEAALLNAGELLKGR